MKVTLAPEERARSHILTKEKKSRRMISRTKPTAIKTKEPPEGKAARGRSFSSRFFIRSPVGAKRGRFFV